MNKAKLIILLFMAINTAYSQTQYEVLQIGPRKDSIRFNPEKHWYLQVLTNSNNGNTSERLKKLDLKKDIRQYMKADSLFYISFTDTSIAIPNGIIIGRNDTLSQAPYRNAPYSHMSIGFQHEINEQYVHTIRTTSPYINLVTTGQVTLKKSELQTSSYNIDVVCDFDQYAYYKIVSFGNGKITGKHKSFIQSVNKLIKDYELQNGLRKYDKLIDAYVVSSGHFDNDCLRDFIILAHGRYFLLLSYKHDFSKKQILHIETDWTEQRCFEF